MALVNESNGRCQGHEGNETPNERKIKLQVHPHSLWASQQRRVSSLVISNDNMPSIFLRVFVLYEPEFKESFRNSNWPISKGILEQPPIACQALYQMG